MKHTTLETQTFSNTLIHNIFFFVFCFALLFKCFFDKSTLKLKRWSKKKNLRKKRKQINVNALKRLKCLQGNIFANFISRNIFCWLIYLVFVRLMIKKRWSYFSIVVEQSIHRITFAQLENCSWFAMGKLKWPIQK